MLKKISLFFVVTILLLAGIMKIDANERGSQSKRGLRNVEQKAALENVELPETNETTKSIEIGKIITDKVLPVELGKYYFTVNDKVYEVNLTTKEIKAFAEELPEISGSFFMVGADGQIYEMTDSRIDGLADSDKLRSVKSAKKSKSKKKILKSVSNSSSAKSVKSSRDARSVAGEDLSIKPITKFSVVGNDRYVYEYDLINKTVNKKDEFEYEIEDGKIYIKTGEEFETVDIQKLKDSKIEKLKDSDNENESERAVKSRSARSVRRSQTGNRGERRVEQLSGQDSKISDTEIIECTESGLIKIILKAEYSALIKKNEKIEGRIITKKPLNIDKSKIYFVENGYIYEADLKNNCIGKFIDKQVLKTNKYWFTVKPDGNILAVKLTDLTNDELTDSTKKTVGDRGVKSKSSPNRRVRTAGDRSETEVDTGLKDIIESDLRLKQENYIMAGKDRILYLYDIEKNEIFKYSKHSEEIKENQVLIIDSENNKYFIDLEKGTIEISKIEKFEDSEQEGDRGIRSRRSPKSQRPKIVKFGKSMKKTAESTVRSKRGVRSVSLQTDEEDAFLLELLSEFMLELEPAIEKISAGKLAFASSTSGQNSIEKFVNDGDVKTRWSSIFFDNHWISIDLGDRKKITKVVLNWERACGLNYKIQVSDDNINWIDAANITDGKWEIREIPVDAYGRYVRMNGVKRATQWGFSIWEFDIYGSDIVDKVEVDLKMKNAVIKSITDLINELPEVSIVKTEDREKIFSVLKLIEASKKYGASEADISNLDKLVKLENQLERLAKKNIMPANIIALNMSNEIVKSDGKGNWNAIGSGYNFIAVGADGELWTLKSQEIYRYKSDNNFEKIGGALVNISIGKNIWMVYGTNSSGAVYWRHPTQNVWQKLGGTLKQLSVGSDKTLFGVQSNQTIWELSNNNWNKLNGELNYVSVGNKDNIWGLTKDGQIYQYASGNWKQIDGNMKFISANNGNTAYGLDANNNVFKWQNAKWQQLEGQFKMLDVKTDTEIVSHFSPEKEIESKNIPINLAIDAINALPEILSVKIEDKDKIEAAKKIVAEAKAKGAADSDITNLDKISKLEAQITALEKKAAEEAAAKLKAEQEAIAKAAAEEEKKNAIKSAIDAITAFPEVSAVKIEDKDKIEAAKKIVAEAKAKGAADADITNLEKITQLESKIGELEKIAAEAKDISIEKISVGKNASASSGTAKNAIDGNVNTLWAAGWFDNEWIAIDLGDRKKITKVALNWERCGSEYKIQVSDNNEIWKDAAHIKNGKTENKEITVDVLGRYVLLKAIKCPNGGSAVREFDIYGRDLTAAEKKSEAEAAEKAAAEELAKAALNLALNKSITAMSQNRSYPVKNIVDGDTNTYWLTDEGGKPNFTINFGVNTEMTTLKIKWHSRRLREGKVIIQFNNTTGERISFGYKPSANEEIIYIYKYYNTNNSYEWKNYFGYYESTGSIKASSINFQAEADGNFSKTGIYEFAVHNENAILAVKAKEAAEAQRVENAISMVINNIQILPEAEKFKLSDLQNKINYKYDPSSSSSILMKESVSKIRQNINELINKKIAESRITNLTKFVNIETKIKEWSSLLTAANDAIKAFPEVKNASTADKEKLDKARAMIESIKNAGIEESQILNHEKFAAFDVKYAEQMSGTISNGRRLNKNDKVVSQNGTYLIFKDGNLFLFDKSCKELWHANNLKSNECAYAELIDGSFQIFTWNGTMRWTSNTDGKGDYITVTDKGVEIYDKSKKPVCDIVTSQNNNLNYQTYNYEKEWADLKTRLEPGKMLEKGDKIYCYGDKKVYLEFIPASSNKTTGIGSLSIYITDDAGKFPQVHKQLMSAENAESCYMDSLGNLRVMSNTGNELWTSQTGGDDKNKNAYAIVAKSGNEYVLKIMTAEGIEAATDNQLADEAWKTQFKQGQKHYIYEKMTFAKGEYMSRKDRIISSSFVYTFGLNDKCELELVRKDTKTNSEELLFTTKDKGVGSKCVFQEDGNLVLLDKNNSKVWESGIKNQSKNKMLILTGDGDLIIDSVLDSVNSPLASVFKISVLEAEKKLEEQAAAEAKEKDEAERRYIFKRGRIMKAGGEKIAQMTYPTYVDAIKTGIAKPFIDFNVTAYIPADTNVFRISMKKIMTAKEEGFDETYDLFYGCNSVVFEEDGLLKFIDKNGKIIQSYNNATAMRFDGSYNFVINTNDGIVNLLERKSAVSKAAFEEYFVSKYDKNRNIMWFEAGDEIILDNGKQFVELDWTGKPGVLRSKTDAEKNRIIFLDNGILARYISNMDNTASVKEKLKWSDHENRIIWSSHDAALFSKINPNKVRYAIINDLQYNDIPEFAPTGNNSIAAKGFDAKSMDNWVEAISLANDMFNAMQGDYLASISIIFKMNQAQKDSNAEADKYSKLNLLAQCPKYISIKEVKLPQEKMKGHKLTLTADGKLVLYNKSGEIIWSFDTKLNPFPSDRFLYIDPKDGIVKIGKKNAIVEGNTHFINEL